MKKQPLSKQYLIELMDDFIGQNWRDFIAFAEEEHGEQIEEDTFISVIEELKEDYQYDK